MFLFKKLLGYSLLPLSLSLVLLIIGVLLLWLTRRQVGGKVLVTLGAVLILLQGYGWGFAPALRHLERAYPPLTSLPAEVQWVVVLGGGTYAEPELPLYARLSDSSLARLVEGVRLYQQRPGTKLLVSGGRVYGSGADADSMRDLAIQLGVKPADIVQDDRSPDTETQARIVRDRVGDAAVVLVTSAAHMPRSVGLFQQAGVNVTPAPTQFLAQQEYAQLSPHIFFPRAEHVYQAQRSGYEYMGIVWAKLRGVMQ